MLNIPTFDPEMKVFILDCAREGMTVSDISDEFHRQGFSWVREHDVETVIKNNQST